MYLVSYRTLEVVIMYAIIEVAGKQYKVSNGSILYSESLGVSEGSNVNFKVLAKYDDSNLLVGNPYLDSIVSAKVLKNGKKRKVVVFKYKPKKNYKRKRGHRQQFTKLEITSIG